MPLIIKDFKKPTSHPFGMLEGSGISHTSETEGFMAWCLGECIRAKNINAEIKTECNEDWLTRDIGLLRKIREQTYKLTEKAKCLLYVHYGINK